MDYGMESLVATLKDGDVFPSEREALEEAVRRCRGVAAAWTKWGDDMAVRLAKAKG
jgi:hypothetical protein